jgi:sorbitol-specific phosphotransferase system component IIBC
MKLSKKGLSLMDMAHVGMLFVMIGVIIAVGALIETQIGTTLFPSGPLNSTVGGLIILNASTGLGTLSSWLPLLAVITAAAVVLGVLVTAFIVRREGV